jgi:hypothetical protein
MNGPGFLSLEGGERGEGALKKLSKGINKRTILKGGILL